MTPPPIIVTGLARSGSSFFTSVLHACGMWVGSCLPPSGSNPRGFFENRAIKSLLKEYVAMRDEGRNVTAERVRRDVLNAAVEDGWDGQAWGFKEPGLTDFWEEFYSAFPGAQWIVCRRNRGTSEASFARAPFGSTWRPEEIARRFDEQQAALDGLNQMPGVIHVWADDVARGDLYPLFCAVRRCGLTWNRQNALHCWDPCLWTRSEIG